MIDKLKKYFKPEEEKVEMTTQDNKPALVTHTFEAPADAASYHAVVTEASQLKASLEAVTAELASLKEVADNVKAELAAAQTALAAVAEEKAQAVAAAHAAKMAKRQAAVEANIGTDKAAAFMEATKELDDTAFAAICSAMAGSAKAEADSELFKEVGVETKAEASAEPKVTHFKQFIKGKK